MKYVPGDVVKLKGTGTLARINSEIVPESVYTLTTGLFNFLGNVEDFELYRPRIDV